MRLANTIFPAYYIYDVSLYHLLHYTVYHFNLKKQVSIMLSASLQSTSKINKTYLFVNIFYNSIQLLSAVLRFLIEKCPEKSMHANHCNNKKQIIETKLTEEKQNSHG